MNKRFFILVTLAIATFLFFVICSVKLARQKSDQIMTNFKAIDSALQQNDSSLQKSLDSLDKEFKKDSVKSKQFH
ncbi:MAG: hypothetical protein JST96_11905 [Bacteroidetes bacterium]|nr:hypothetical protein [Bacteroidota bacterium]